MNNYWYIDQPQYERFCLARERDSARTSLDAVQRIQANADRWANPSYASANLRKEGDKAVIPIKGVLLPTASEFDQFMADVFGGALTTYEGIASQIEAAEADPTVNEIVYDVDTPGGHVKGLDHAAIAIATSTKPSTAVSSGYVASAGYYLASQAGKITALDPVSSFGSIGTVVDMVDATEYYSKLGVRMYSITSDKAPNKRLEPHSEEFVAQVKERVNAMHDQFVARVCEGRSVALGREVEADEVNENFGRGGLLLAGAAKAAGMIDAVEIASRKSNKEDQMGANMVEQEVHDVAVADAKVAGMKEERARVASLLPWMSTDSERVTAAITSGEEVSSEFIVEMSGKAAEKAKADAIETAKATAEAEVEAAVAKVEGDKAPELSGVETSEAEETADEGDALMDAAMKLSKNPGKGA